MVGAVMEEEGKTILCQLILGKTDIEAFLAPRAEEEKICIVLSCLSCMPNEASRRRQSLEPGGEGVGVAVQARLGSPFGQKPNFGG